MSKFLKSIQLADRTNLFYSRNNLNDIVKTIEKEIMVKKCFGVNKLYLNTSKTKRIIFGNREINTEVKLRIDDAEIERVFETKFQGVILDHKLNCKMYINHVTLNIFESISILHHTKDLLNQHVLYVLY